jgi:hypothetical protein
MTLKKQPRPAGWPGCGSPSPWVKRLWIAWEETGIRLTCLLTQVTAIPLTRVHREDPSILQTGVRPAKPSISLTGVHSQESGILPTGVHRSYASQAEVLHQPQRRLTREDQEPGGGFSLLD